MSFINKVSPSLRRSRAVFKPELFCIVIEPFGPETVWSQSVGPNHYTILLSNFHVHVLPIAS